MNGSTDQPVSIRQEQGKWTARVPTGFHHDDDGYLRVLPDPDRDAGEVGYLGVRRALERVSDGASYRAVANDLPNLTRQGLMKIDKDADRREWYLGAEATDALVDTALESIR